jgi:hypothetical protein
MSVTHPNTQHSARARGSSTVTPTRPVLPVVRGGVGGLTAALPSQGGGERGVVRPRAVHGAGRQEVMVPKDWPGGGVIHNPGVPESQNVAVGGESMSIGWHACDWSDGMLALQGRGIHT